MFSCCKHGCSCKFPYRPDRILSHLWLIRPSLMTNTRSISETQPFPIITEVGCKPADCPILFIFTIPKFIILGHCILSEYNLVEKALRGFPQQGILHNINIALADSHAEIAVRTVLILP